MKTPLTLVLFLLLAACSGSMGGAVINSAGQAQGPARLEWEGDGFGSGTAIVYMPDGEVFRGGFSSVKATASGSGYATSYDAYGNRVRTRVNTVDTVDTGQTVATLISNRGNAMECLFYGDTHGTGRCNVSDGRTVALTW